MIVLIKFEFKEFIREVFLWKFFVESVDVFFVSIRLSYMDFFREIDFFVVYRRVGVVFIEVKVIEKFKINCYLDVKK